MSDSYCSTTIPESWFQSDQHRTLAEHVDELVNNIPYSLYASPFVVAEWVSSEQGITLELSWRRTQKTEVGFGRIREPGYFYKPLKFVRHNFAEAHGASLVIQGASLLLKRVRGSVNRIRNVLSACSSCGSDVGVIEDTSSEPWECFGCDDTKGYVYALTNPIYDAIKVGYTNRTPEERREELSDQTACPSPFEVATSFKSNQPKKLEREVHRWLSDCRVSESREFFSCDVADVKQAVANARGMAKEGAA